MTVSLRLVKITPEGEEEVGPEHRTMQLSMGAVPTDGKTAEEEVDAIDKRCFERYRNMLDGWRAKFEEMFPGEDCPHIFSSSRLNWDTAAGGSGMSDACPQAQAMSRLIEDKVRLLKFFSLMHQAELLIDFHV